MIRPLLAKVIGFVICIWVLVPSLVAAIFKGWKYVFGKKERTKAPDILRDPRWGLHRHVQLPGLMMHYVENGDHSKPLMIFVHGFPEFWFSWRHQIEYFAKDYWCVAVDNRGYGETDKPSGIQNYSIDILADDIANLSKKLGREKFILVGHDWGGAIGYHVCNRHRDMVDKYIVCNFPHPLSFKKQLEGNWRQLMNSWYIFMFQCPYIPERFCQFGDIKMFNGSFNDMRRDRRPSKEEIECYKYTFNDQGAFHGPINYYRHSFQYGNDNDPPANTQVPVLQLWGVGDKYLHIDAARGSKNYIDDFEEEYFEGVSHWTMHEIPSQVNEAMEKYLNARK